MTETGKTVNRLENKLAELKAEGKKALAVFLMGGDPDMQTSAKMLKSSVKGGADILEIGVPFSDPLADGPVNQKAAQRSLNKGTTIKDIFDLTANIREEANTPIALLLYYNTIYRFGPHEFFKQAKQNGVDALVIPDLPFEEKAGVKQIAGEYNLIIIDFIAPTTSENRMKHILGNARGFVYCVSVTGVTGVRNKISPGFKDMINKAAGCTGVPLFAGFGISSPEQAREAVSEADGVIVGSVLVREVECNMDKKEILPDIMQKKVSVYKQALQ